MDARGPEPAVRSSPLDASVAEVPGIGPKRLAALEARGLATFRDVLFHLPYRYEDLRDRDLITELIPGAIATVEGALQNVQARAMRSRGWRRLTSAILKDASGATLRVAWFNLRGDGQMPANEPILLHGPVSLDKGGAVQMLHPEVYRLKAANPPALRPVYSLPPDFPQRLFAEIAAVALARAKVAFLAALPSALQSASGLPDFVSAVGYLHQPPNDADAIALSELRTPAHQALAFDEMFTLQLALGQERRRTVRRVGAALPARGGFAARLRRALPFSLTSAQERAISEISNDLTAPTQMHRILIGDVGSGKTLVAFHAMLQTVEAGWQAAMMAPTELLAEQHFENFTRHASPLGITAALLTGKLTGAERARMLRLIRGGAVQAVFGTHALFQPGVELARLGLAIIDEQHRFGVFDRARLLSRGVEANLLLMTATPIPRSLALTLLRNLDVSRLDESPAGRTPVATDIFDETQLPAVDNLVAATLTRGERAYYVLPLIDGESERESVATTAERLRATLRTARIGVLHGRMHSVEKERVMREFRDGALNLLVATTVIEVGVDVPAATLIVITAAERYGLAQLHQLRGRVGRSAMLSRCCLVISSGASSAARRRLDALAQTARGDEIAELDLRTRGPGDLFGTRQSGALPLRFGRFIRDLALIEHAGILAEKWLECDQELSSPASRPAADAIRRMLSLGFSLGDVG